VTIFTFVVYLKIPITTYFGKVFWELTHKDDQISEKLVKGTFLAENTRFDIDRQDRPIICVRAKNNKKENKL